MIEAQVASFRDLVVAYMEAGMVVATLEAQRRTGDDIRVVAMFLKRVLNDLRAVWLLLVRGYTSQAASVAAALFENALVVSVVAGNEARAREVKRVDGVPWSTLQLTKFQAKIAQRDAEAKGKPYTPKECEELWQLTYYQYKWLCQLKHPTPQAAIHDLGVTLVDDRQFAVLALPDMRKENLPVKVGVLAGSLSRTFEAIKRYGLACKCDESHPKYRRFENLLNQIYGGLPDPIQATSLPPNPIRVYDRRFMKGAREAA